MGRVHLLKPMAFSMSPFCRMFFNSDTGNLNGTLIWTQTGHLILKFFQSDQKPHKCTLDTLVLSPTHLGTRLQMSKRWRMAHNTLHTTAIPCGSCCNLMTTTKGSRASQKCSQGPSIQSTCSNPKESRGETTAAFPGDTRQGSSRQSTPSRETHEGGYPEPGKSRFKSTQWTRKESEPCSWVDRRAQICPGTKNRDGRNSSNTTTIESERIAPLLRCTHSCMGDASKFRQTAMCQSEGGLHEKLRVDLILCLWHCLSTFAR